MSCPYKYIFGKPETGVHSLRFFGFAVNDTLMTIIAAILTAYYFKIDIGLSLIIWFVSGEILHYGFGVDTAFMKLLGVPPCKELKIAS